MSVTYLIEFDVRPAEWERFVSLLNGVLDAMRTEPKFHEAGLHADPASEHRYMLCETWESHEDVLAVQLGRPYRQAWRDALEAVLAAPRDVTIWTPMRADRRRG